MKILQLIYSLESGGAERFTVDLSNEMSKNNEVMLCTILDDSISSRSFYKQFLSNSVHYINLKSKKGTSLSAQKKFFIQVFKFKPDVIHVHLNTFFYAMIVSLFYKKCKYVHTIHSVAEVDIGKNIEKRIKGYFYKRKIFTPVTISSTCKESIIEYLKIENVYQINNGCSFPVKTMNYNSVLNEINGYKRKETEKVFVHIARYHEYKNQQMLINVFNRLNSELYDFVLLIIGSGFDSSDAKKIKDIANDRIYFLGEKSNVKDYLFCSDAFVLTSKFEGLPISLLEAISCGNFVICTPAGGIPDVIRNENIGYVSNDFSEESYYKLILKYFNNKETIDKNYIVEFFKKNYSIENCAQKYEKIYQQ